MKGLKGVLFDYGHTLVYFPRIERTSLTAILNVQKVLKDLDVLVEPSRVRAMIESFADRVGNAVVGMEEEFTEIFRISGVKNYTKYDVQEAIQAHWKPYIQNGCLRKGAKELLKYLKERGLKLGVVANIWSGGMNPVLERLGVDGFFDTTVASVDVGFQKPNPEIFHLALNRLKLYPKEVLMVGDNPSADIEGARDVGIGTVRLLRGPNRTKPDAVDPDFKIRNLSALTAIIHALSSLDNERT
jgi:HAD superfamily hydrolase (TIGR01549 family)